MHFVDLLDIHASMKHVCSLPLSEVQRCSNAIEIHDETIFNFYMGLPHIEKGGCHSCDKTLSSFLKTGVGEGLAMRLCPDPIF